MYNRLKNLNELRKKNNNYGYYLTKELNKYVLTYKNNPFSRFELTNLNELISWVLNHNDKFIINIDLLKDDKKFLSTFYISSEYLRNFVIDSTVVGNVYLTIRFKLVKNIDTYIAKLCLTYKVFSIIDNIFYVILKYGSIIEIISEKQIIVNGNRLNFMYSPNLEFLYIDNLNINEISSLYKLFYNCVNLKGVYLKNFNTKHIMDMQFAFCGCVALEKINLEDLDLSNVCYYDSMLKDTVIDINRLNKYGFDSNILLS